MCEARTEPENDGKRFFSRSYLSEYRWSSYWHQIECVLKNVREGGVLEIGVGNGTVSNLLKTQCTVTTFDVNPDLSPDIIGDVRDAHALLGELQFEVILCAEVLEHLPFDDFVPTLGQLLRHARNALVLGLPHSGPSLSFWLKLPLLPSFSRGFKFPLPIRHPPGGVHQWEIGKRGYSLRQIRQAIREVGSIAETYVVPGSPHHRMFVLKGHERVLSSFSRPDGHPE